MNAVFGILKTFIYASIPFAIGMGLFFWVAYGFNPIFIGAVSGFIFGVAMAIFVAIISSRTEKVQNISLPDQNVIKSGNANHLMNVEAVGGWIFLTNEILYFKSHDVNVQVHEITLSLQSIIAIEKFNTLGIVPNGLRIVTNSGSESFILDQRNAWIAELKKLNNLANIRT